MDSIGIHIINPERNRPGREIRDADPETRTQDATPRTMMTTDRDTGGRIVTWTAFPDRSTDRFRLVVLHLAAGVPLIMGLAVLVLLALILANGLAVENHGTVTP